MAGRPPIWDDAEAFSKAVDEYFDNKEIQHTWTGLALHLGFCSRDSLNDYKQKEGFSDPIKKALLKIEAIYEKALFSKNAAGPIFALKNFGWRDRQEIRHEVTNQFFKDPLDDSADDSLQEDTKA